MIAKSENISIEILKSIYLFSALSDEDLKLIVKCGKFISLKSGESLFSQGQPAESFFWVKEGQVKIFRCSVDGDEKVFHVFDSGQTFAEAFIFQDKPCYQVCAQAIHKTTVLQINSHVYRQILHHSVDTCFRVMAEMSSRIHGWLTDIDNLTLKNANYRLIHFLQSRVPCGQDHFDLDIPKNVLASRLSVKPETLSRLLKNLQKEFN